MNEQKKHACVGLLAHVDAGKTTLAEAILYRCGALRSLGRVDHGNTALDFDPLERERGITIFAAQAHVEWGDWALTLLDTPGHVDFSAETERMLRVLDCAILVISGIDGVQAHTRTLWKLLDHYQVPTVLFVTKMDLARNSRADLLERLRAELGDGVVDFSPESGERDEQLALCGEAAMEEYLETGVLSPAACRELFAAPVQVLRRTKRGEGLFLITDHIRELTFSPEPGQVRVRCTVSCAEPVVNPDLLTAAVVQNLPDAAPDAARFRRLALYKSDGSAFR